MRNEVPIQLVVGLGNIGPEYAGTRHNCGFLLVEDLAAASGRFFRDERKFNGSLARVPFGAKEAWLLKPSTYMNLSGLAVCAAALYYRIPPEAILVVHDELDLEPGDAKLKFGGGTAGHNGLKSVAAQLGTPDFWRLRIGIGHPRRLGFQQGVADYVLSRPSKEQLPGIEAALAAGLRAAAALVAGDYKAARAELPKTEKPKKPKPASAAGPAPADAAPAQAGDNGPSPSTTLS